MHKIIVGFMFAAILLAIAIVASSQELNLQEIQRQKELAEKDFQIGNLMVENARLRFEKLTKLEADTKLKESKNGEAKEPKK